LNSILGNVVISKIIHEYSVTRNSSVSRLINKYYLLDQL